MHPYQSMRRIVRDKAYVPLIWLPTVCLGLWWLLGLIVSRYEVLRSLGLSIVVNQLSKIHAMDWMMAFGFMWGIVFLLLWQLMLGYLFVRFRKVVR